MWVIGLFLIVSSLIIQLASLAFWLPLEIYQGDDFGHPQWVIWLRFKNIVAFALGKMDAWGLNTDSMGYDQWDYQHIPVGIFCRLFCEGLVRRRNGWWMLAFAAWYAGIAGLIYMSFQDGRSLP